MATSKKSKSEQASTPSRKRSSHGAPDKSSTNKEPSTTKRSTSKGTSSADELPPLKRVSRSSQPKSELPPKPRKVGRPDLCGEASEYSEYSECSEYSEASDSSKAVRQRSPSDSPALEPSPLGWERSAQEEQMRDEVIELLKELGMYSKSFLYLIESCVQLVVARNMAFVQLRESGLVMSELSREGEPRLKAHPACNIYLEINKELRQVLEALKMTIRSSNHSEGDEMDKLNSLLIEKLSAIPQE